MKLFPRKIKHLIFLFSFSITLISVACRPEKKTNSKYTLSPQDSALKRSAEPSKFHEEGVAHSNSLDTSKSEDSISHSLKLDSLPSHSTSQNKGKNKEEPTAATKTTSSYTPPVTEKDIRQGQAVIEKYHPLDDPDPTPDPDPDEFVPVDTDPVLLNWEELKAQIKKPPHLADVKGTVYLKVLISRKGYYRGHLIRRSPHPELTAEVVKAVKQIRAKPATYQGKPVKVWVNLSYEFK